MKTKKLFLAFILIFTLISCGNNNDSKRLSNDIEQSVSIDDNEKPTLLMNNKTIPESELILSSIEEPLTIKTELMIIKKGTMNIETENYSYSEKELFRIVNNLNGYISNYGSSVNASSKKQGEIDIRIQAKDFDTLISEVSKTGKVISVNINSSDITEEFIDLEAREKTQKALEGRLINLLNEKTAKLTDVVEVEEKLASVRSQIESMQGRMRYLKNQSEFSTLTVSMFETNFIETASGGGFFQELSEAFKKGLEGFTEVIAGLITFVIATSPVIILIIVILFILKKYYSKWKIRKQSLNTQTN